MRAVVLAQMATLRITSPADGAVVHSGETFTVTVEGTFGNFVGVALIPPSPIPPTAPERREPPFTFSFQIPETMRPGLYPFVAAGTTDRKERVLSNRAWFDIERPDPPVNVQLDFDGPHEMHLRDEGVIQVWGTYKNGDKLILNASRQTTFRSEDPHIVAIHDFGVLIPVAEGTTKVLIQVGDRQLSEQIIVKNKD